MALRDELNRISERERNPRISEEEVYQQIVNDYYRVAIKDVIVNQYKSNPNAGTISGSFSLSDWSVYYSRAEYEKIKPDSYYYHSGSDNDGGYSVRLKPVTEVTMKEHFASATICVRITPLGEKVYRDLCQLARRDEITLSQPQAFYYYEQYGMGILSPKKGRIPVQIGVPFKGKSASPRANGVSVEVSFSYRV